MDPLTLIGAASSIGSSIFGAISANKEQKRAARQRKKEEAKMKELEDIYANLDTSNPYLNLENTMEDLTVDQKQAEFERQSFQQTQANIMTNLAGAAGGSGIANLAQSLAQQGQIASQKQAASIGQQERANQMARQQMAGQIQLQERQGEIMSRDLKRDQTSTLLGMAQQRTAAAAQQEGAAKEAKFGAIASGITGIAQMTAGFGGDSVQPGGIFGESGAKAASDSSGKTDSKGTALKDKDGNVIGYF